MNKQRLLASVAVAALLAVPSLADTEVSADRTSALTTGALLTDGAGDANAGNIKIDSGESLTISHKAIGAITVDSSNYVLNIGTIKNKDVSSAYGLHIDVSTNPDLSTVSFTNNSSTTVSGTGIYMDSGSSLVLSGDGTGKYGFFFDTSNGTGTYTGNITFNAASMTINGDSSYGFYFADGTTYKGTLGINSTSSITMDGDSSYGVYMADGSVFNGDLTYGTGSTFYMSGDTNVGLYMASGSEMTGDLTVGGTFTMSQAKARNTSSTGLYGLELLGKLTGDLVVASGGSVSVVGASATGISVQGYGIDGAIQIAGAVSTAGYSSSYDTTSSNSTIKTYPEAGTALAIGASITDGVAITGAQYSGDSTSSSGSVSAAGTSPAISISPGLNSSVTQTSSLVLGVYTIGGSQDTYDPGFSFYNRGSISATPSNYNASAQGVYVVGTSVYPTILTGGFYNSGTISASGVSNDDGSSAISAIALYLGNYTYLDNATFDYTTGTWTDTSLSSKGTTDQAAFVNSSASGSGKISATVSGTKAGSATAFYISQYASVPSLINSGTISASATTTDKELDSAISSTNAYTLEAVAISDASGTLTSIYNTGTISAYAGVGSSSSTSITELDNNKQLAVAIDLSSGNTATPSGSGVTIKERATGSSSAAIIGDIYYGTGDNQILDIQGTSSTYTASVVGNVHFGDTGTNAIADTLNIGAYGILKGKVTAGSGPGVAVNVASNGTLYLENDTTSLNAASVHVANDGNLSIGVSQSLTTTGAIESQGDVVLEKGSNLGLTYESFVPQGSHEFVLITAPYGKLSIDSGTLNSANNSLKKYISDSGSLPFLFESASLEQTSSSANGDSLVLNVTPKTSSQLGLTGYASTMFPYVNSALANDNDLGSAMIYGIHNQAEAQKAYASFTPNVSGGDRAVALSLTDQSTGVVAARQRSLLMYAQQEGAASFWFNEFAQMIKDPGQGAKQTDGTRAMPGFKDNGFGLSLGVDSGTRKYGWYGAALTFFAGDVSEMRRISKTNDQWLLLTGYTVWRGKGLFFNSKVDVGYGQFDGKRTITLATSSTSTYTRVAENKHAGALVSGGFSTGTYMNYGSTTFTPMFNVDGMFMRQDGYTESNPGTATDGDAFDLKVEPSYAKSLRAFMGLDVRYDVELWDFFLQPEARMGYRYDFLSDPQKLKAAFAFADTSGATAAPGSQFTITGPDPAKGNLVLGASLAATTQAWSFGFHYDFIKGTNGMNEQVGTFSLVGRI